MTIAEAKKALRRTALAQRAQIDPSNAADKACAFLIDLIDRKAIDLEHDVDPAMKRGAGVSGYVAMKGELDPRPALLALEKRGCTLLLPYTTARGEPLRFLDAPGARAPSRDACGLAAPPETAAEQDPAILLVPLAAFDRRGHRLGYGGGFYDAALTRLRRAGRPVAIGWAYAAQEVAAVPTEPHDAPLDWIVTEREAIYIQATPSSR